MTENAKRALVQAISEINDGPLVVSIAWVSGGILRKTLSEGPEKTGAISPGWGVGFYKRANVTAADIADVGGIECILDERLAGKVLDFADGQFVVVDNAI